MGGGSQLGDVAASQRELPGRPSRRCSGTLAGTAVFAGALDSCATWRPAMGGLLRPGCRAGALVAAEARFQLLESEERHEGGRLRGGSFSGQGQSADPPGSSGLRGAAHGRWIRPIVRASPPLWPPRPCRRDGGLGRDPVRLGHQNEFCGGTAGASLQPIPIANCVSMVVT